MDANLLCRICAKEDRLCIQVFGTEGKKQGVAKKIRLCLPIIVKETDDLPKQICLNCLSDLDASYELYTRSLGAQSTIKNLMGVSVVSSGEMVKVYSTQEMLDMMNELRETMSERRPAVRLGNTVYTIREVENQTEAASNNEQGAKKRKHDAIAKTGGQGMMIPVAPVGQQYMMMPSGSMMMQPGVPHGQFTIAPMSGIPAFPMQAVSQTSVNPAPVAPSSAPTVTKPGAPRPTTDTANVRPGSATTIPSEVTATNSSNLATQVQVTSIQTAIQAFQNSTIPRIASVPPFSSEMDSTSILPQQPNSSLSVRGSQGALDEDTPLADIVTFQNPTSVTRAKIEQMPSEIITSDAPAVPIITKRSPRSSPTNSQQSSPQKSQTRSFMVNVKGHAVSDEDDDDEYAADDPDPLQNESEEEEQDTTTEDTIQSVTKEAPGPPPPHKDKDSGNPVIQDLSSDSSVSGGQSNKHRCPYCKKYFPEDVIFHHKKLHFRQKFFSCIVCNKNFRTEAGLENHRCEP